MSREVPLNDVAVRLFESQLEKFRQTFGREPVATDRIFFDMDTYATPEVMKRETVRAMVAAKLDPALIYAFERTDLLVTEENHHLIPIRDLEEWDAAILEYRAGRKSDKAKTTDGSMIDIEVLLSFLRGRLADAGPIIARLLRIRGKTPAIDSGVHTGEAVRREFAYFCLARAFQAIKATMTLSHEGLVADALAVVRSLYEVLLQLIYVRQSSDAIEQLVESQVGLVRGTHSFEKRPDGRINTRVIIRLSDGRKYRNDISPAQMARASRHQSDHRIFDALYGKLSREAHPSIRSLERLRVDGRLAPVVEPDFETPVVHTGVLTVLVLEQIYLLEDDGGSNTLWRDIEHAVDSIAPMLVVYLDGLRIVGDPVCHSYPMDYALRLRELEIPSVARRIAELCPVIQVDGAF